MDSTQVFDVSYWPRSTESPSFTVYVDDEEPTVDATVASESLADELSGESAVGLAATEARSLAVPSASSEPTSSDAAAGEEDSAAELDDAEFDAAASFSEEERDEASSSAEDSPTVSALGSADAVPVSPEAVCANAPLVKHGPVPPANTQARATDKTFLGSSPACGRRLEDAGCAGCEDGCFIRPLSFGTCKSRPGRARILVFQNVALPFFNLVIPKYEAPSPSTKKPDKWSDHLSGFDFHQLFRRYSMSFSSNLSPHSGQNLGGLVWSSGTQPHLSHR